MRTAFSRGLALALGLMAAAAGARAAALEKIGSWTLDCRSGPSCLLRCDRRLLDKAGMTGDLEVGALGPSLVPVIALRGVPSGVLAAAAMVGKAQASIQLSGGPREDLDCAVAGAAFICAPGDAAARRLAQALPTAGSASLRVSLVLGSLKPVPLQEKSLPLSGTPEALARLRAVGAVQLAAPTMATRSPEELMGLANKALRAAGYHDGIAGLQELLSKYTKKQGS